MLRHWLSFVSCVLLSLSFSAQASEKLLAYLRGNIISLPSHGSLIQSFSQRKQSYIYDQALAIIAFTHSGEKTNAHSLLKGLEKLQLADGSLYFSYNLDGSSPYPQEGDRRYAGAIAWVALAAASFQQKFQSTAFLNFNRKLLSYLSQEMISLSHEGKKLRALRFNPSDLSHTQWNESEVAALEHNLDALAAFSLFSRLNQDEFKNHNEGLENFVMAMWDSNRGHFWSGMNLKSRRINKEELYLDNQSWSLLALSSEALKVIGPEAVRFNCEKFLVKEENQMGFIDRRPANRRSAHKFIWSEGSAGQILAMKRTQKITEQNIKCEDTNLTTLEKDLMSLKNADGGIAYATSGVDPDFTKDSSVAGTAWAYFVTKEINPFRPFQID